MSNIPRLLRCSFCILDLQLRKILWYRRTCLLINDGSSRLHMICSLLIRDLYRSSMFKDREPSFLELVDRRRKLKERSKGFMPTHIADSRDSVLTITVNSRYWLKFWDQSCWRCRWERVDRTNSLPILWFHRALRRADSQDASFEGLREDRKDG